MTVSISASTEVQKFLVHKKLLSDASPIFKDTLEDPSRPVSRISKLVLTTYPMRRAIAPLQPP